MFLCNIRHSLRCFTPSEKEEGLPCAYKQIAVILFIALVLTALLLPTGIEHWVAEKVYTPGNSWAWWMRQYSNWPGALLSFGFLLFLLLPFLRKHSPQLRRLAVVWVLTALFGGGLINQVIVNELIERPRPRQIIPLENTQQADIATLKGRSFPSGHATLGFIFAVPFFVWRRKRPRLALASMALGLGLGGIIGYARMVAGAHFMTDIIGAGAICLATGAFFAGLYRGKKDVQARWILLLLLLAGGGVVLGNSFKMDLVWQGPWQQLSTSLPCEKQRIQKGSENAIHVQLQGYGAPVSALRLQQTGGEVSLYRGGGVYHSLSCTAIFVEKE